MLHYDNASSLTAMLTVKFLGTKVVERTPHSMLLLAVFNLKKNLRGPCFQSEDDIDEAIKVYSSFFIVSK